MILSKGDSRHPKLPPERFYFAVLDRSMLPRTRLRQDETKLGYLFEDVLPCPIESIAASFAPIDAKRVLACGIDHEVLAQEDLEGAWTLGPASLPDAIVSEVGESHAPSALAQLNVLTGDFEPRMLRAARRRKTAWLVGAALIATALGVVGLESRMAGLRDRLSSIEAHETLLLDAALGKPAPGVGNAQRRAALIGEQRQLARTRGAKAASTLGHEVDVAARLAALLHAWPTDLLKTEIDSLGIDARGIEIRGNAESAAEQQSLVDALGTQPGLEAEPPRFRVSADGKVEFEIGWIDPKSSGGSR